MVYNNLYLLKMKEESALNDYDLDYFKDNKKPTPRHAASNGRRYADNSGKRTASSGTTASREVAKRRKTNQPAHSGNTARRKYPAPQKSHKARNILVAIIAVSKSSLTDKPVLNIILTSSLLTIILSSYFPKKNVYSCRFIKSIQNICSFFLLCKSQKSA